MTLLLSGKTAVITGSGRGIGRGIALELAKQGCSIAVNFFRKRREAEQTAADIIALGAKAAVIKANVGNEEDMRRLIDEAAAQLGGVDILVGNAASGVQRPLTDVDAKAWDWTLNINARSILVGAQAVAPYMRRNGWGRIITVSSMGARRVLPNYSVVGVSKAAIEALTRYLAVELAPDGIIVNGISPGVVLTEALDVFANKDAMLAHALANTPARRLVTTEDIGRIVTWLCSDAASMIVGQIIEIDGGYSLVGGS